MKFIRIWCKQFCLETHLHGFKFIALPGRVLLERCFWAAIIVVFWASALTIILFPGDKTVRKSMIFVTDSTQHPIWNFPFPAVTICSFNKISKQRAFIQAELINKKLNLSIEEIADLFTLLGQLYSNSDDIEQTNSKKYLQLLELLDHNKVDLNRLLRSLSPSCDSVLIRCRWKSEDKNCDMLFEKIITPEGHCCSFNYYAPKHHKFGGLLYPARSPSKPRRVSTCGQASSLELLISTEPHDYHSSGSLGFGNKIVIHNSYDYPDCSDQSILVGMKVMTLLGVSPTLIHSTNDLKSLAVEERGCYYRDEFPLQNFGYYTYQNCLTECRMNLSRHYCGCIPVIYINEDVRTQGSHKVCSVRDIDCLNLYRPYIRSSFPGEDIEGNNLTDSVIDLGNPRCPCLPECSSTIYEFRASSAVLETKYTPWTEQHGLYHGVDITNHSDVNVYFEDLVGTRNRRKVIGNWQTSLAFYGGILGIFSGFSFISGIELIYFFTAKVGIHLRKETKMNEKKKKHNKNDYPQENKILGEKHISNSRRNLGLDDQIGKNGYFGVYLE